MGAGEGKCQSASYPGQCRAGQRGARLPADGRLGATSHALQGNEPTKFVEMIKGSNPRIPSPLLSFAAPRTSDEQIKASGTAGPGSPAPWPLFPSFVPHHPRVAVNQPDPPKSRVVLLSSISLSTGPQALELQLAESLIYLVDVQRGVDISHPDISHLRLFQGEYSLERPGPSELLLRCAAASEPPPLCPEPLLRAAARVSRSPPPSRAVAFSGVIRSPFASPGVPMGRLPRSKQRGRSVACAGLRTRSGPRRRWIT